MAFSLDALCVGEGDSMGSAPKPVSEEAAGIAHQWDIDGFCPLAIIPVFLYHAFPSVLSGGFVGMDLFFVISGFLISGIIFKSLRKDEFSYRESYARRIQCAFLALAIILITVIIIKWISTLPSDYEALGKQLRLRVADLEMQRSLDVALQMEATGSGAQYASPLSLECPTADCLITLTRQLGELPACDYGHLTQRGSSSWPKLQVPELVALTN